MRARPAHAVPRLRSLGISNSLSFAFLSGVHTPIAGYTSLCLLAEKLGFADAVPLLKATLAEQATDQRLGLLAEAAQIEQAEA